MDKNKVIILIKRKGKLFASEFLKTFYEYDNIGTRHSPILIIFLSFFEKIKLIPDIFIRLIHSSFTFCFYLIFFINV